MNIILLKQQERLKKIAKIKKALENSENPDINRLIMMCCSDWGISKRTAKEFIEIAKFNIENESS